MSICIEYEKVTLAREYNRLTQKELIEKLKQCGAIVSQGELSKIELGQRKEISEGLLEAFSLALNFPIKFFTTPTNKENIKGGLYRKKQSLKKKDQDYIEASTNIFKDAYLNLLNFVEIIRTDIPYYSTNADSPKTIAQKLNINYQKGVYAATTGPSYETPSEVKMFRMLGANAVGMSTAPEAIVANYCGLKILGISCLTNYAAGVSETPLNHQEVIDTANRVKESFKNLLSEILKSI